MKVNTKKILNERKSRAWSQQHLADVSALSLRTIQRVEKEGTGSPETVKALAACFELDANELLVREEARVNSFEINIKTKLAAMCSSIIVIFVSAIMFFVQPTMALDMEISADQIESSDENNYQLFSGNVEIFVPEEVAFEVESDELWGTDTASVVTGSVKVVLDDSTLVVGDGVIIKVDKGVKITTDYAELRPLTL
ncbi:helix-turn-helix transcriptional regulator [Vibrio parahaemolyticus]|uniref:helix-turn-helix domain-containing protein n=1 Tax=Vibrio parahaemolyticus TaxID=670 RepID=UPI000429CB36|nr:helix-turn-helix transcriptional regulator [Vibrio parahaemolyticus]EJG1707955.1 helix-turn-helix transcriptional regulator [Vibrio parahaemolyticus]EJG1740465.1 helix-turn-helix transcriptional regulator [Vibrio parahaemolyticus]EJG1780314.1 helix-turn-helix transcriptional regulator [Vibrio parahaemolyticus]MDF4735487.1 helix-turn-helix transcriptional regulator [Vibrio parahaemolyticus]MDG2608898.1 helix-turn-helix transcriptional regulator [Vibrio parahaemolyticus]